MPLIDIAAIALTIVGIGFVGVGFHGAAQGGTHYFPIGVVGLLLVFVGLWLLGQLHWLTGTS